MKLTIHTLDTAPSTRFRCSREIREQIGVAPNLACAIAESPVALGAFDDLRRAAAATSIDPIHREIAGLATGVVVDNQYGVAFHSTMLANLGVAAADIARMRSGQPPSDVQAAVVHRLATELASGRGKVDEADYRGSDGDRIHGRVDSRAGNGSATSRAWSASSTTSPVVSSSTSSCSHRRGRSDQV